MNYIEWLAFMSDMQDGREYFTVGELYHNVRMSRQTVHRYVKKMTTAGYVKKLRHGKYSINMECQSVVDIARNYNKMNLVSR